MESKFIRKSCSAKGGGEGNRRLTLSLGDKTCRGGRQGGVCSHATDRDGECRRRFSRRVNALGAATEGGREEIMQPTPASQPASRNSAVLACACHACCAQAWRRDYFFPWQLVLSTYPTGRMTVDFFSGVTFHQNSTLPSFLILHPFILLPAAGVVFLKSRSTLFL